jgi:hypothetical protein
MLEVEQQFVDSFSVWLISDNDEGLYIEYLHTVIKFSRAYAKLSLTG